MEVVEVEVVAAIMGPCEKEMVDILVEGDGIVLEVEVAAEGVAMQEAI